MSNASGRAAFFERFPVSRETHLKLEAYARMVATETTAQNLVAASTLEHFWRRHMLDSAQLVALSSEHAREWADVGSGAGLPGIVVALLTTGRHTLIEPRRLRAEFLGRAVADLELGDRVTVQQSYVERVRLGAFDVITARAFAPLWKTLEATMHIAGPATSWILHKGRTAAADVAEARQVWDGDFVLTPSITDPDAAIVTVTNLQRRTGS